MEPERACLAEILRLWRECGPARPPALWIARHRPLPPDAEWPETSVDAAWYGAWGRALQPRRAEDYVRFLAAQSIAAEARPPATAPWGRGRWEIGLAAFAPYRGSDRVYVDCTWHGLNGRGAVYRIEGDRLEQARLLWLS